jgi:serine/threonine protein kinase/tetratricopeptide (TPR) repeat protein
MSEVDKAGGTDSVGDFDDVETLLPRHGTPSDRAPSAGRGAVSDSKFATLEEFSRALVEIGLVTSTELKRVAAESSGGVLPLSRALVKAGKLTAYQAAAVYQKKSRGLVLGNYVILDKLGQGGMGVVFLARHRLSGRLGALKILPPSFSRDTDAVSRFRREIDAAGRLNHPNVVAAIDSDQDRGVHFLVMDYVDGSDLDRVVRTRGPLPVDQAVSYLIHAAKGLEAAHAQGIVHRDIKPGNLMLDANDTVRVLDLGLARFVDASNPFSKTTGGRLTQSGMYMGTVDYMAPEQAEDAHRVDHRADIYSLGCSFYFLLTGREPFPGETVLKRLMAHMEREPPSLQAARPEVSPALEACYLMMMAKRPDDRPKSMTEVIARLQASKLPPDDVLSRVAPPPKSRQDLKVFDETPLKRAGPPRTKAQPSIFARTEKDTRPAIDHDLGLEDLVMDVRSDGPATPAEGLPLPLRLEPIGRLVTNAPKAGPSREAIAVVAGFASAALLVLLLWVAFGGRGPAEDPNQQEAAASSDTQSPEGDRPQTAALSEPIAPEEKSTLIFDGKSARGWMLSNHSPVPSKNIQPDGLNPHQSGSYLVVYQQKLGDFVIDFDYKLSRGCNSGVFLRVGDLNDPVQTGIEVALDDTRHGNEEDSGGFYGLIAPSVHPQKPAGQWNHMTITAAGPQIAVALNGMDVANIDLESWTARGERPDGSKHRFKNRSFATSPRSGYLGFQDLGGDCWFKNVVLKTRPSGPGPGTEARSIAKVESDPFQKGTDPLGEPLFISARFARPSHPAVRTVSVLPGGKTLLTAAPTKAVVVWDIATGSVVRRLWHPANVNAAAVLPDGTAVVTDCSDSDVRVLDLSTGSLTRRLSKQFVREPLVLACSPDNRSILAGGNNPLLFLWDIPNGTQIKSFEGQSSRVESLAFSRDGGLFFSGGADGIVRLGNRISSKPIEPLSRYSNTVYGLATSADGRRLVAASLGFLVLWNLETKTVIRSIAIEPAALASVAFRDSRHVFFATHTRNPNGGMVDEGVIGVWDVDSNRDPLILNHGIGHSALALGPNGMIVTGGVDGVTRVWEPSRSIAQARAFADSLDQYDKAIELLGRGMAGRPNDARLLITRARLLTQAGRSSEAEAFFTLAAQLAHDNPQLFLDDGWWVAGPYDTTLDHKTAIEETPALDPSQPPPTVPGGLNPRWRPIPTGTLGHVDLTAPMGSDRAVAYALAFVYSSESRKVALAAGSDDSARIWVNGAIAINSESTSGPDAHLAIITLRPGRNSILVRATNNGGPFRFDLRLSVDDTDFANAYFQAKDWAEAAKAFKRAIDREPDCTEPDVHHFHGESLAYSGRYKEACAPFKRALEVGPKDARIRNHVMACYAALGDSMSYRSACQETLADLTPNANGTTKDHAIRTAAILPGALADYSSVLAIAKKAMDDKAVTPNQFQTYGALLYRAKQYQSAVTFLNKAIDARKGKDNPFDWAYLAMARHRVKMATAKTALARAESLAKAMDDGFERKAEITALLDEARRELSFP